MFFFDDVNREGYAKKLVENEFKLPLNDKVFEVWTPRSPESTS